MSTFMKRFCVDQIYNSDSYKYSHFLQNPPGTQNVSSYIESRGVSSVKDWDPNEILFFGLSAFLQDYMTDANVPTIDDVYDAEDFLKAHGEPFNFDGWLKVAMLGHFPLLVEAIPEGTVAPVGTPLVQARATADGFEWLASFFETCMIRGVWYPTTVATQSRHIKKILKKYLDKTGSSDAGLPFMLNDFGSRGVSSLESSVIGGMAHLVSFMGTDNVAACYGARHYYDEQMAGFSVIASEHSTMTAWGRDHEVDAYRRMLSLAKPNGIVSVVSDSYNIYNAASELWGGVLKDKVNALADKGARLVVRPDSGDPITTPFEIIKILMDKFGYSYTSTGHKVLPTHVRVLQGDGINDKSIGDILAFGAEHGLAAENYVFGMGSGMLQEVNRDTLKFAQKANAILIDGQWHDVYKDPVHGGKTSKRGRQAVVNLGHGLEAIQADKLPAQSQNYLQPVYENGNIIVRPSFSQIRSRAAI